MIVPFFPPIAGGGVYRPLAFVKYLGRHGWRPTVVAQRGEAFWIADEALVGQVPPDCRVVRTESLSAQRVLSGLRGGGPAPQRRSSRGFGALRRLASALLVPDTYVGWKPYALRAARRLLSEEPFHAIYSTSPPETSHLVAGELHETTRLPWVADFRDPWMNLHLLRPPSALHARWHARLEARVARRATLVVPTRWQEADMRRRYAGADVVRIPNGFDGEEAAAVAEVAPPKTGPLRIVHVGMLTQRRSAAPFLRGLRRFCDAHPGAAGDVAVTFLGAREDESERVARALSLENVVSFRSSVSHAEALRAERASHILLLIKHADVAYDGLVPGKLYEYIGAGRPILALAPPGEAGDLVHALSRGEVVDPGDETAVAAAIARLLDGHRRGTLDHDYDLAARPELDRAELTAQLAAVLNRIGAAANEVRP
jgi:glycosyltransferase involved in cell wall biosynthesis